ncbi:MAG: Abi family protein [Syntrophobacteraceae bacterium]
MFDPPNHFCKPALDVDAQIKLLNERGLLVTDHAKARHYLRFVGYYRLSGYFRAFYVKSSNSNGHTFKPGTTFRDVLNVYIFDRELRLLVMDAIERIEVAFRACLSNTLCIRHGAHWFLEKVHFTDEIMHSKLIEDFKREINRSKEVFIKHYQEAYCHPELPPGWMVVEVIPLGTLSFLFKNLASGQIRKEICRPFQIDHKVIESWLHTLSYLRNICAHHSRLWNRRFSIKPAVLRPLKQQMRKNDTFYAQAVILYFLMRIIADGSKWQVRLAALLEKHNYINPPAMGFPDSWKDDPFWRLVS